ncbi:MAG: phosphatidate cytidylyltransferase [Gammaproteobacteria bacterium]|nr:phosphatidate cytidylyltransferase [Gammaproteobacteria bacterium]
MLKQRIMTAVILIPLFIYLLFNLPPTGFSVLTGLVVFWAATEWSLLMGIKKTIHRLFFPFFIMVCLFILYFFPFSFYFLYAALGWWIIATILVIYYPKVSFFWAKSIFLRGLMGLFVLIPCWLALNFMRYAANGIYVLLYLFIIIWGADIGAYFVGRKWGKNKIAPHVSPGKSWEGLLGALLATLIIALPILFFYQLPYATIPVILMISIITVLFSVIGDLFESMLKRNVGLKDSGTLLPGHGGILDRIDSLCAAAPIFVLGLVVMSKFYS